jgi:hypothetical protein
MSRINNRNLTNILPKINSKVKLENNMAKIKVSLPFVNSNINQIGNINILRYSKEKKPGTSITTKKPIYILPEIQPRKLSKTASIKTNSNSLENKINNNDIGVNSIEQNLVKKRKEVIDYQHYQNECLLLLINEEDIKKMYNQLYGNEDINDKKKWIEENLFKREVFLTILESYIKNKIEINNFIKREISRILRNKLLDMQLSKSLKLIQFQYDEYINNIHNA